MDKTKTDDALKQANKVTFIASGFQWYRRYKRGYETSGSPLHFMLRRSSLVECVTRNMFTKCVNFFFINQYVQPCLSKNPKYTFDTIKSSLTLAYYSKYFFAELAKTFFFCLTQGQTGTGVLSDPWAVYLSHHFLIILYITCQILFFIQN